MAQTKPRTIRATFNVLDTGRTYTGKQRDYILDNVKEVINSPAVRERLRLRQLQALWNNRCARALVRTVSQRMWLEEFC